MHVSSRATSWNLSLNHFVHSIFPVCDVVTLYMSWVFTLSICLYTYIYIYISHLHISRGWPMNYICRSLLALAYSDVYHSMHIHRFWLAIALLGSEELASLMPAHVHHLLWLQVEEPGCTPAVLAAWGTLGQCSSNSQTSASIMIGLSG